MSATYTLFGEVLNIEVSAQKQLVIAEDKCVKLSSVLGENRPLYFYKKDGGFDYFYFDNHQIFFLNHLLFIPDVVVNQVPRLKWIFKEALISKYVKSIWLDPFCKTSCYVVDCSDLEEIMIVLHILSTEKFETITYHKFQKNVTYHSYLPKFGIELLNQAKKQLAEVAATKKQMSQIHYESLGNWLSVQEEFYVGKLESFTQFHAFQKEVILKCIQSLKICSVNHGFLLDMFMGSGKTWIALSFADYLRTYYSDIEFIVLCPVSVEGQWLEESKQFGIQSIQIHSWDSIEKFEIQSNKLYYLIADEAHYAYGDSNRNQMLSSFISDNKNVLGSLHLTGTPYNGKPQQIVYMAKALGHRWGKYTNYYKKLLESMEDCSKFVKDNMQNCIYSLRLSEAKLKYGFKIPEIINQEIFLDLADPNLNDESAAIQYQQVYEQCLKDLVLSCGLDSIKEIPDALKKNYMKVSQKILQCFERLKVDWIENHSHFPAILESGQKIVFFTKYQESAKRLYKALSHYNDAYHLKPGNYRLQPHPELSMVELQLKIGQLEQRKDELKLEHYLLLFSKSSEETKKEVIREKSKIEKQLTEFKSHRERLAFTYTIKKSAKLLSQLHPSDRKLILNEHMIFADYKQALIYGGCKQKDRDRAKEAFNSKNGGLIFLVCTLSTGGTGLNLHHDCDLGVLLGIGDNFRNYEQALWRIGRFGNPSEQVQMFQIMFSGGKTERQLNLEQSLYQLYLSKSEIVGAIKSQEFEQTPLYELTKEEIFSKCAESMGFSETMIEKIDKEIKQLKS